MRWNEFKGGIFQGDTHISTMFENYQTKWLPSSLNFHAQNDSSNVGFLARKFNYLIKVQAGFANNVVKWDLFTWLLNTVTFIRYYTLWFSNSSKVLMVSKLLFYEHPWLRPSRLSKEFKHFLPWWKKVHGHFLIDVFLSAESGIKDFQLWIQGRKSQLRWEV